MSQLISHFLNISEVIHAFLLAEYRTTKPSIVGPLKGQHIAILPPTNSFHLSVPDMFGKHNTVT
jgi:hypothetical protein